MDFKTGIQPADSTFGELLFVGLKREKFEYDRDKGRRTDNLEARIYNLVSETQQEQIEVTLAEHVDEKEIQFNKKVKLINPLIKARAQANGNFANVIWTVEAEDIVEIGASANTNVKKESLSESKK